MHTLFYDYGLWLVPLLPLLGAVTTGFFWPPSWREKVHWVAIATVAGSFLLSATLFVFQGLAPERLQVVGYGWIAAGAFQVHIGLLVDPLSALMVVVVSLVSLLVHIYSVGYMQGDPGYRRYFAYLNLFTFAMLMLVLADNFLQLYVFWEAVGLCSYLLIGFWYEKESAAQAGKKAFLVNRVGDYGFALGVLLIFVTFGTLDYLQVFEATKGISQATLTLITLLLLSGAIGKSAQLPLHVWLPDAMEGPTPVSALIHAATMVTAGVYLIARASPLFAAAPFTLQVVAVVGALTALFAASIAVAQTDIKRILAYSTISQLGYMFLALGLGAYTSGIFHLVNQAFIKALLFLGAGSVIHALGEQDIRKMGGLQRLMKLTGSTFLVGALAIAGIPPLAGFWSKDEIFSRAFETGSYALLGMAAITSLLTAFYMFRLYFLAFSGPAKGEEERAASLHEAPPVMAWPLLILAVGAIVVGMVLGYPPEGGFIHRFLAPILGGPEG